MAWLEAYASMGPRLISRGVCSLIDRAARVGNASMGPRLISRGVRQVPRTPPQERGASMGPRLISRGVSKSVSGASNSTRLQWGRGSLAAACIQSATLRTVMARFNGAAAH